MWRRNVAIAGLTLCASSGTWSARLLRRGPSVRLGDRANARRSLSARAAWPMPITVMNPSAAWNCASGSVARQYQSQAELMLFNKVCCEAWKCRQTTIDVIDQ